jgi:hypothetical protein
VRRYESNRVPWVDRMVIQANWRTNVYEVKVRAPKRDGRRKERPGGLKDPITRVETLYPTARRAIPLA